jgi:hypothetical protein
VLSEAAMTRVFWVLAGTFFICGVSTNGITNSGGDQLGSSGRHLFHRQPGRQRPSNTAEASNSALKELKAASFARPSCLVLRPTGRTGGRIGRIRLLGTSRPYATRIRLWMGRPCRGLWATGPHPSSSC